MPLKRKVDLTFSDLLYAVVAGSAFQHFTPYEWRGWESLIILAALLVLADDWVLYHAQATRFLPSPKNSALVLVMDIVVLLIWYFLARYGAIGAPGFKYFLFLLSGYYLVIAVCERILLKQTRRKVLIYTDLVCGVGLAAWATLLITMHWTPHLWMVPLTILALVPLRYKAWKTIVFQSR